MPDVPGFEELVELISGLRDRVSCVTMQVVLVRKDTGSAHFISVNEKPALRLELKQVLQSAAIPLGVLGWSRREEELHALKFVFPWVKEDQVASRVFDQICDQAARGIGKEIRRREIN